MFRTTEKVCAIDKVGHALKTFINNKQTTTSTQGVSWGFSVRKQQLPTSFSKYCLVTVVAL